MQPTWCTQYSGETRCGSTHGTVLVQTGYIFTYLYPYLLRPCFHRLWFLVKPYHKLTSVPVPARAVLVVKADLFSVELVPCTLLIFPH
jgi:hypothetical protein